MLKHKRIILILTAVTLLVIAGTFFYQAQQDKHSTASTATTTSTNPTAQNNYTKENDSRSATSGSGSNTGGVKDTNGGASAPTSGATPVTSSSGKITLLQPGKNQQISSGAIISGAASVDTVQFRLVDNEVGVIAQGQLNVVAGKYSGEMQFKSSSTSGYIDVFSLDPSTGAEINSLRQSVAFK